MDKSETQAALFKALMHPARLAILEVLREGEQCVCHMEAHLGYRQAYISQQLTLLREAGLVDDRRDGWNIFYRVIKTQIFELIDLSRDLMGGELSETRPRAQKVNCPCPKCNPALERISCDASTFDPQSR